MVDSWFLPCDAIVIYQIKLIDPSIDDKLSWYYTKDGLFTVRSSYHLQLERREEARGEAEQADSTQGEKSLEGIMENQDHPEN